MIRELIESIQNWKDDRAFKKRLKKTTKTRPIHLQMMTRWGVSANSHNASLSVFVGDQLVFASSERYSKIKNDPHLCKALIDEAMWWGVPHETYWYENPRLKSFRQFIAGQKVPKG